MHAVHEPRGKDHAKDPDDLACRHHLAAGRDQRKRVGRSVQPPELQNVGTPRLLLHVRRQLRPAGGRHVLQDSRLRTGERLRRGPRITDANHCERRRLLRRPLYDLQAYRVLYFGGGARRRHRLANNIRRLSLSGLPARREARKHAQRGRGRPEDRREPDHGSGCTVEVPKNTGMAAVPLANAAVCTSTCAIQSVR